MSFIVSTLLLGSLLYAPGLAGSAGPAPLSGSKLILLYDHFYNSHRNFVDLDFDFSMCEVSGCAVTEDRSRMADAEAVWFHQVYDPRRHEMQQLRQSNSRNNDQYWVWCSVETPTTRFDNLESLRHLNDMFNLSMTYRLDANVRMNYNELQTLPSIRSSWREEAKAWFRSKNKTVAWTVSHCHTNSRREAYFEELRSHLSVDLFGNCHHGQDTYLGGPSHEQFTSLMRHEYKFYLAFENSLCTDYITEKMWYQGFFTYTIPIVRGGKGRGDYHKVAPPGSFIDTRDFKSAAELAEYIKLVASNEDLFLSYHRWREAYGLLMTSEVSWHHSKEQESHAMCRLCAFLHSHDPKEHKFQLDLVQHWTYSAVCEEAGDLY